MAKLTSRDLIWNIALMNDSITAAEMEEKIDVSERTARDCLQTMHEMGWLQKHGGNGTRPVEYGSVIDSDPKEELLSEVSDIRK